MTYRSAILGCGPRAVYHMMAYDDMEEIKLEAACDLNDERRQAAGQRFSIPRLDADFETMLREVRPDILHIVTPPAIREDPISLAVRYGVKGILVEKPIAMDYDQLHQVKKIVDDSGIKVAVNTQRRYFAACQALKDVLDRKLIGDIEFVRIVTKANMLSMGPHAVDLLLYFLNDQMPLSVWATAFGMNGYEWAHPAPAHLLARYTFPGGLTVYLEEDEDAIGTRDEAQYWMHLEFDIWGANGRAWWTQNRDWGYQTDRTAEPFVEETRWRDSDYHGQREFTRAMAHWLDNPSRVHLNHLDSAIAGFDIIMSTFESAWQNRTLSFPVDVSENIVGKLESRAQQLQHAPVGRSG